MIPHARRGGCEDVDNSGYDDDYATNFYNQPIEEIVPEVTEDE